MNKKVFIGIFLALLLSSSVFFMGYTHAKEPRTLYRVYLEGKSLGYIESKDELEGYIDQEESFIKDKYKVSKVSLPNNLDVVKEKTFTNKISSVEEIYDEIKEKAPFTIEGYEIKIKGVKKTVSDESEDDEITKTSTIYVLDKKLFVDSLEDTIKAFVNEEDYEKFVKNLQQELGDDDVGRIIENIYIKNKITIKKGNIPVTENIYTDNNELNRFLLFGENPNDKEYKVKVGDTIEQIAFNNKMSSNEFLVANPDLTSEDNLLYTGQIVNVATIDPAIVVAEDDYVVEIEKVDYETVYKDDNTLLKGKEKVQQEGQDGLAKVSYNLLKENGETITTENQKSKVIKKAVNKIVLRGTKKSSTGGGGSSTSDKNPTVKISGVWHFPIQRPYKINSPYGYRWGKLHAAVDLVSTATKYSKIYAANNGVVWKRNDSNGEIIIRHSNGYYTTYCHMKTIYVKAGDTISSGQVIGIMGKKGRATGVHLHFGLWKGKPYYGGSVSYNPLKKLNFK